MRIESKNRIETLKEKFEVADEIFISISGADPTENKKYTQWLLNLYKKNELKLEDLYKATEYLTVFRRCVEKNLISKKDINTYKTLASLFSVIESFMDSQEILSDKDIEDKTLVFESENWKIHIPENFKESQVLGSGTQWCTASSNGESYFNNYNSSGFLVIFANKNDKKSKFQMHMQSNQFATYQDNMTSFIDFIKENEELKEYLKDFLTIEASKIKDRLQDRTFVLKIPKIINQIEEEFKWDIYSKTVSDVLSEVGRVGCSIRFSDFKNVICPQLISIGGDADFRGYEKECPRLTSIEGDADFEDSKVECPQLTSIGKRAYFRGYDRECPQLTSIGGNAYFEDSKAKCPQLTSIGEDAYFRGYEKECPQLTSIGKNAYFRGYARECPQLTSIGGDAYFEGYESRLNKQLKVGGQVYKVVK